jgi:sirohydrochlorin cobaltochelatase
LVGHGSAHPANTSYAALMWQLQVDDPNIYIGAISGFPEMEDIQKRLEAKGVGKVWLMPFMSVAGDHAQNDIFGDEDSWQSAFTEAGIAVEAVKKGIAEYDVFVDVWIEHLKEALSKLPVDA